MGIRDSVQGQFSSLPPFTAALEAGVQDEIAIALKPIITELNEVKSQLAALGVNIQSAIDTANTATSTANIAASAASAAQTTAEAATATANSAQNTANTAQTIVNNPPPPVTVTVTSPTITSPVTETTPTVTIGTPTGEQPPPATTPTVTATVRDQLISVSVDPLSAVATIGQLTGAGLYAIGESATLTFASPPQGYTFDGWYNVSGQRVSTDPAYTFVVSGGGSFVAKFVATPIQPTPAPQPTITPVSIQWSKAYVGGSTSANLTISGNGQSVQNVVSPSTPVSITLPLGTSVTVSINVAQAGVRYAWIDLLNGGTVSNQRSFTFTLSDQISYRCVVS